jgi:hypothetical protein
MTKPARPWVVPSTPGVWRNADTPFRTVDAGSAPGVASPRRPQEERRSTKGEPTE